MAICTTHDVGATVRIFAADGLFSAIGREKADPTISVESAFLYGIDQTISCSKESNSGVEKNSPNVISKPSHSFLMVTVPGFWLSPFKMLFIVACGTAEILLSPLGVIPRSLHSSIIRAAIASRVFMDKPSSK